MSYQKVDDSHPQSTPLSHPKQSISLVSVPRTQKIPSSFLPGLLLMPLELSDRNSTSLSARPPFIPINFKYWTCTDLKERFYPLIRDINSPTEFLPRCSRRINHFPGGKFKHLVFRCSLRRIIDLREVNVIGWTMPPWGCRKDGWDVRYWAGGDEGTEDCCS